MIEMIETIETIEMHTTSAPRVGFEKEVRRTCALRRRRPRSLVLKGQAPPPWRLGLPLVQCDRLRLQAPLL